jgi:hypothetical protein
VRIPFRVEIPMNPIPGLTAKSCGQPWALGRNAFGVESGMEAGFAGLLSQHSCWNQNEPAHSVKCVLPSPALPGTAGEV